MSALFRKNAFFSLLFGALLCLFLSSVLSFKAGCAGDAKGGSLGDIRLALHYGSLAAFFLFAGMSIGSVGFLLKGTPARLQRNAYAAVWFFCSGTFFWVAAFQAEVWGVKWCF